VKRPISRLDLDVELMVHASLAVRVGFNAYVHVIHAEAIFRAPESGFFLDCAFRRLRKVLYLIYQASSFGSVTVRIGLSVIRVALVGVDVVVVGVLLLKVLESAFDVDESDKPIRFRYECWIKLRRQLATFELDVRRDPHAKIERHSGLQPGRFSGLSRAVPLCAAPLRVPCLNAHAFSTTLRAKLDC
jgi:hypothetical protein